ncbi:MAG TPA: hypothetical protein ENN67_07820, partial [Firmicutes bacterium]|nr:hypothetical protein [Bacillota bacterium]
MDLSLKEIYLSSLKALVKNPLIYLLLIAWGLVQGLIIAFVLIVGAPFWIGALLSVESGESTASTAFFITLTYFGFVIFMYALLSAATRAGVLAFGAKIRCDEKATTLTFVDGIFRFTWRLFIGGIVVGMLTWIPILAFAVFIR